MPPNPRAFLFFDSKQQVVNSSLFTSAQVKNSLSKLKRKKKINKTGKFPEKETSLSSVTWFKIKSKTELLFPKEFKKVHILSPRPHVCLFLSHCDSPFLSMDACADLCLADPSDFTCRLSSQLDSGHLVLHFTPLLRQHLLAWSTWKATDLMLVGTAARPFWCSIIPTSAAYSTSKDSWDVIALSWGRDTDRLGNGHCPGRIGIWIKKHIKL